MTTNAARRRCQQSALQDLLEDNPESGLHDLWVDEDIGRWNGVVLKRNEVVAL
jgi:hypothetical protein